MIKIPPPLFTLLCAALMWLLVTYWPFPFLSFFLFGQSLQQHPWGLAFWRSLAIVLSLALTLAAAGCIGAGLWALHRHHTTVNPFTPQHSQHLVTHGIYRFSRNPMYLGMALLLAAWAIGLGHLAAWSGVIGFVAAINRWPIAAEEQALMQRFGPDYAAYCRQTRRWL